MKLYLNKLNKSYSIIKLLKYAVMLSAILLIVDIFNLPSKYLSQYGMTLIWIFVGAVFLILFLTLLEFNFLETFKMVSINLVDGLSFVLLIACIIYGSVSVISNQLYIYKFIIIIVLIILLVIITSIRGIRLKMFIIASEKYIPNVYDLREIFRGGFTIEQDETILVNEKDVDYDLLERENVINQLYNSIKKCNPDGRFVISLEGKWGCGKTTIINNVKRRIAEADHDIIIIDEFDPWSYCDQESLFSNMFDILLQKSGLKYSYISNKQMAQSAYESIFGSKKTGLIMKSFFKQKNEIGIIKNKINDYLKVCGKKVVFFIDNIDRAESDNIILLFKLVGNVFDFERVTYVLSFDNERVKKIFENQLCIDYLYLKKVIQMQIRVPEVDRNILNMLLKNVYIIYLLHMERMKLI